MGHKKITGPLQIIVNGAMTGTSTITSSTFPANFIPNVGVDASNFDNIGLEVTWTGTPTGTISVLASISGINFYALTFSPALAQPSGSAGGYLIDLNQFPFKYFQVQYVNSSGSGTLNVYAFEKDLN